MNQRVAIVPDLNQNETIEGIANTAGAYVGAATTAVVGGLFTALNGLFRGAVAGAQVTYANAGNQEAPVENTSQARQQAAFPLQVKQAEAQRTFTVTPVPTAPIQGQPTILSPEELEVVQGLRSGKLTLKRD